MHGFSSSVSEAFYHYFFPYFCIVDTITDVPILLALPASIQPAFPALRPPPHCCLCQWVMHIWSLAEPFTFFHPLLPFSLPSDSCQSVPRFYAFVSILFISLFCYWDSTYKWNHPNHICSTGNTIAHPTEKKKKKGWWCYNAIIKDGDII